MQIIVVIAIVAGTSVVAVAADSDVSWTKSGLGVWRFDSGAGVWVDAPGDVAEDPNTYKFEYLCLDDAKNNFDIACLAGAVRCDQGEDGRPVRWFSSLRVFSPPIWSRISPDRCVYSEKPDDVLGRIAAQIQTRFRQLPVNAGNSVMQPSPHTLRGAETNFYAEANEQAFTVDMLGQSVSIVAKPVQYTWSYGDSTSLGPQTAAGDPFRRTAGAKRPPPATSTPRPAISGWC
ncbi:hypothetical protein PJ267_09740 [Arthrobacter sp. OVS8]|nr:hypothetical protein PJ267_09740 [Arthrobacter sp. OVS8]